MCGIAGAIRLDAPGPVPVGMLSSMAASLVHRGPDEDGFHEEPGLGLAARRLSIVGLVDGRQPVTDEARNVVAVFNGELFEYRAVRRSLEDRGHRFATSTDSELVPHLWEDHEERFLEHLNGQFALALWDRKQQRLVLARDRFGICPLYWTRQRTSHGEWLLFASEIKALLASGMVVPRADRHGLEHAFTFLGMPGPVTCFEGIQLLRPGRMIRVQRGIHGAPAAVSERVYWDLPFHEAGQEVDGDEAALVGRFEELLLAAVERRLRADVPVVSYLSGGVDSSMVVAMATHLRRAPIPTFTIRIDRPGLDEHREAGGTARHFSSDNVMLSVSDGDLVGVYPQLVRAAEAPVLDPSCGALYLLAGEVRRHGYKVALTGEGADEWLAGYPWYKAFNILETIDKYSPWSPGRFLRSAFTSGNDIAGVEPDWLDTAERSVGGSNAWLDVYGLMNTNCDRYFSRELNESIGMRMPYADLGLDVERVSRLNPVDRSLYLGAKVHLAGLLLNHKGDRVAMANSVEVRYPFLDESVCEFLAGLHPRWKLRYLTDKRILRSLAARWLPAGTATRSKGMFRAGADCLFASNAPSYVDELLSPESLARTGYFDPKGVLAWRTRVRTMSPWNPVRIAAAMGLTGVIGAQLWHHTYVEPVLAALPAFVRPALRA